MKLWNLIRVALAATFILAVAAPAEAGLLKRKRASQSCGASAVSQSCGNSDYQPAAALGCR